MFTSCMYDAIRQIIIVSTVHLLIESQTGIMHSSISVAHNTYNIVITVLL